MKFLHFVAFKSKNPFFLFLAVEMFSKVLKKCKVFEEKLKSVTFTKDTKNSLRLYK